MSRVRRHRHGHTCGQRRAFKCTSMQPYALPNTGIFLSYWWKEGVYPMHIHSSWGPLMEGKETKTIFYTERTILGYGSALWGVSYEAGWTSPSASVVALWSHECGRMSSIAGLVKRECASKYDCSIKTVGVRPLQHATRTNCDQKMRPVTYVLITRHSGSVIRKSCVLEPIVGPPHSIICIVSTTSVVGVGIQPVGVDEDV